MSQRLIEECGKFALHIENRDAKAWNKLCREMTALYIDSKEQGEDERVFDFIGFDLCHKVVDGMYGNYFHAHCLDDLKNLFYRHSRAVIALTAQEILFRIKGELEIGNYYE